MMLRYEGLRVSLLERSHIYPVHIRVNHDQPSRNALTGMNASNPNGKMAGDVPADVEKGGAALLALSQ